MREWKSFNFKKSIVVYRPTPKGRGIIITTNDGELIVVGKHFKRWRNYEGDDIMVRAFKNERGVWMATLVSSQDFTPVKHRDLFDEVETEISEYHLPIINKRFIQWTKRKGMFFVMHQKSLDYARQGDAISLGILVTNANTARDSIRIFFFGEFLKCTNGLVLGEASTRMCIMHKGPESGIYMRVRDAVKEVVNIMFQHNYVHCIEDLGERKISSIDFQAWMVQMTKETPEKYVKALNTIRSDNVSVFGYTNLTQLQIATAMASQLADKSASCSMHFQREATRILQEEIT
jgi:hypothetical protein